MELRPALRAARYEADERVADLDVRADPLAVEQVGERLRLPLRVVGLQVQLRELQPVALVEQLVDPVAGRVQFESVARVRRDEGPPPAVLLHPQLRVVGPLERAL